MNSHNIQIFEGDLRDKKFRTEDGYITTFSQEVPILSDNSEFANSFEVTKFQKLSSKNISDKIIFELISWDTGRFVTPSYAIEILDDNGEIEFLMQTPELKYSILSVVLLLLLRVNSSLNPVHFDSLET